MNQKNKAELDTIDYTLLRELQDDAKQSLNELASRVGMSASAVSQRIQKLQDQGVITGVHMAVDYKKLGWPFIVFIQATLPAESAHFRRNVVHCKEVIECYRITGKPTYLIKALVVSPEHLDRLLHHFERGGKYNSSFVLETIVSRRSIEKCDEID